MKKIFLSYSTVDEEFVSEVYEILKRDLKDYSVFKFNNNHYHNTQSWAEIDKNMIEANIYLVFISKISMQSKAVRAELYAALHRSINTENFTLKPIIIDDYTNWEKEFKPKAFPVIDSIHRIEEFNRDAKTLGKYIIANIENGQWPNYIPNIKLNGILIKTNNMGEKKELSCFVLFIKSNIDLPKVNFLYTTKNGYLYNKSTIFSGTPPFIFNPTCATDNMTFNDFSLIDNSEISKNNVFHYVFWEKTHFDSNNDKLTNILLKTRLDKARKINFFEYEKSLTVDEINELNIEEIFNEFFPTD